MNPSTTRVAASSRRIASRWRGLSRSKTPGSPVCLQCRYAHSIGKDLFQSSYAENRMSSLKEANRKNGSSRRNFPGSLYPRIPPDDTIHQKKLHAQYRGTSKAQLDRDTPAAKVVGKITSKRTSGKSLIFLDIRRDDVDLQIIVDLKYVTKQGASVEEVQHFWKSAKPGDYYSFEGAIGKAGPRETLSLICGAVPQMLGPSVQRLSDNITNENVLGRFPQANLLNSQSKRDTIRMRHALEQSLQECLNSLGFTKVSTPILAADTGGAVATPFETLRNDGSETRLSLRIAQELVLKELVAADMGPVYEIGPVFRNEGIDATHNPEFTTCEFYLPYTNLDELLFLTESIIRQIWKAISTEFQDSPALNKEISPTTFAHFRRLPFLPTLMDQLSTRAPDFRLPNPLNASAIPALEALFEELKLELPQERTVAHLLDVLGGELVEPLCKGPTFITHYPAVMSPLAKSFFDQLTGHVVSARAELFINGVEYANMYEEENDPFAQAKKFLYQSQTRTKTEDSTANEELTSRAASFLNSPPLLSNTSEQKPDTRDGPRIMREHEKICEKLTPGQQYYIHVLEMGMPPTAGWGCGIERLLMLFSGAKKIADVLPFGNMRSVIAKGSPVLSRKEKEAAEKARGKASLESVSLVKDI